MGNTTRVPVLSLRHAVLIASANEGAVYSLLFLRIGEDKTEKFVSGIGPPKTRISSMHVLPTNALFVVGF